MDKLKQKVIAFMEGRYGVDHLNMALIIVMAILSMLGFILSQAWITYLSMVPLIYCYFRLLSRNIVKRHQENILFLKYWYPIQTKLNNRVKHLKSKKQFRYYKCKSCGQSLRVPRGKGKIAITCPKCKTEFIKKT